VRQLRNLIESMVVLAPGREIGPADIPAEIREGGARLLPVRLPEQSRDISGRELEFIFRSLVDLKMQMDDLRRRIDEVPHVEVIDVARGAPMYAGPLNGFGRGRDNDRPEDAAGVLYRAGMKMTEVEQATIEAALKETHGNRRKAAEQLGIGERTLYRKIKEYGLN